MSAKPNDAGLFGPESVSWQLHAEPAMWLAGIRSLYLQALHPRAVAGIVQNSDFRGDPLGRLVRTANFVGATTYCPRDEVERQAAKVRAVHRSLRGTYEGRTFRIDEPELLLWVHCAEVSSFLTVVRRAGFPLTATHADRYLDEQRRSAVLVGLDPDEVPGSVAAMRRYLSVMRPVLRRTDDTDAIPRLPAPPTGRRQARAGAVRVRAAGGAPGVLTAAALGTHHVRPPRLSARDEHRDDEDAVGNVARTAEDRANRGPRTTARPAGAAPGTRGATAR